MRGIAGLLLALVFFATSASFAAEPRDYQVTGPVLDVKDDIVVVQKGNEKWEIGREKDTKVKGGDLKKGSRVTIHYKMTASSIEVKDAAKTKAEEKKAGSKTK
jgi:hypothetical protein